MGKKRKHLIAFLLLIAMVSGMFLNANRADALWYWQKEYDYTRWFKNIMYRSIGRILQE